MDLKSKILTALKKVLAELGVEAEPVLEFPADLAHGDYATNVAMVGAKRVGKNPKALAEEIVAKLGTIDGVSKIEIAGPGFINFTLAREVYANVLQNIGIDWGETSITAPWKVMVEYTDPNPFKIFHIGHLMSNAIGESIARLLEFSGATVKRANYQGDVGPHIARALWGIKKLGIDPADAARLGEAYAAGSAAYEADPAAKTAIDALNIKVYDRSDPTVNAIYDAGRAASLAHFEKIYEILGTKFDFYFFESETGPRGLTIVTAHPEVFEKSDGAIVYKGEQDGLHTRVFVTAKGLPTYEAKDLGLVELKQETWPFDTSITITAEEQAAYFKVVLAALGKIMPDIAPKIRHVTHGMMRLPSGKMSSRTGDVVTGESLLADVSTVALERAKESRSENPEVLAQVVAVAAIKYQILKQATGRDIIFDRDQALSLSGDSGPYLQYSYARAMSVLEKARTTHGEGAMIYHSIPAEGVPEYIPTVERLLPRFPDIVMRAASEYEPHYVTTYLTELAGAFNSWYATEKIIGSPDEAYKLLLVRAFAQTMKNGLWLLGINAPEKM